MTITKFRENDKFVPGKSRIHYGGAVIDNREVDALLKTIETSGGFNWTIGKKGQEFERILSGYTKQKYTILTNSGSSSLLIGLLALRGKMKKV